MTFAFPLCKKITFILKEHMKFSVCVCVCVCVCVYFKKISAK